MSKITTATLKKLKADGEKFATITAYDAAFAKIFDQAGIHLMLVGDSMGMVLQGGNDTISVTTDEIAYHTKCVASTTEQALIMADMPFMSYPTKQDAFNNAHTLMRAGAHIVKMEGGGWLAETITELTRNGIPVCAHLGLTPQSVNVFGGFKVQGRDELQAEKIVEDAILLEKAGAQLMLLECVPESLGKKVTEALEIPVIGIGAGRYTDAQILVMHDMLGLTGGYVPKFSKNYVEITSDIRKAVTLYIEEVKNGTFPGEPQIIA